MRFHVNIRVIPLLFILPACDTGTIAGEHEHTRRGEFAAVPANELSGVAKDVQQATARFHSRTQALAAGYVPDSPCVAVPGLGGMGFHWVNHSLVDPVFDPHAPEAVLYEPGPNGQLKLIGLEYIVINVGQTAPTFEGQAFDVDGAPVPVPHWTLHLWVHKTNPSGLFAPFNPEVVCP